MNDCLELGWGSHILGTCANELVEENQISHEFAASVGAAIDRIKAQTHLTAMCFSKNGDSLGQWRGYADDGKGFAIGFRRESIESLPCRLSDVSYDKNAQMDEASTFLRNLYESSSGRINKATIFETSQHFVLRMATMKSPSFSEEEEIRAIHALKRSEIEGRVKLAGAPDTVYFKDGNDTPVNFRMKSGVPIPYVRFPFDDIDEGKPIKCVVLGPNNNARKETVEMFLETVGLVGVYVSYSESSYRSL